MSTDIPSGTPDPVTIVVHANCRATIQEGPRKGAACQFPAQPDGYCGRHKRNKEYDEGIAAGKRWCRFFFRGCSFTLATEDLHAACDACRKSKTTADPCKHEGCRNKQKPYSEYCGKHQRDALRATGIRYCDIARGCLNVCEEGFATCADCREKQRIVDAAKRQERRATHGCDTTTPKCVCCGKEYAPVLTARKKKSKKCAICHEQQKKQDELRKGRARNYGRERYHNPLAHIEMYKTSAEKRGIPFNLTFEQFKELVVQPCFYCGHHTEEEAIGIDRFNNNLPYDIINCKPCCELCNRIKYIYPPRFFVIKCKAIAAGEIPPTKLKEVWPSYYMRSDTNHYLQYKATAKKRKRDFELTEEQFRWITSRPCCYCRQEGPSGIDRIDNKIGYTITNAQPCCMTCNMMRKDLAMDEFIDRTQKIANSWTGDRMPLLNMDLTAESSSPKPRIWKACHLYRSILMNTDSQFTDQYADSIDIAKYAVIREFAKGNTKEESIPRIRTFLATLKKKRYRLSTRSAVDDSHIDHI